MPYLRDRVVILKREPFREQDRRYTMYGRDQGLLVAVARGTSLKASKQAGHLEPFSQAEVMIAKGVAFDKLAVARSIGPARSLDVHLAGFAILGSFHDLLISLTRPGMSDDRLFDLLLELRDVCFSFRSEPSFERSRLLSAAATLKLLDILGFGPFLDKNGELPKGAALIAFMRRVPLADTLRVTATTDVFAAASAWIEGAVQATPLSQAPRGLTTLRALLVP